MAASALELTGVCGPLSRMSCVESVLCVGGGHLHSAVGWFGFVWDRRRLLLWQTLKVTALFSALSLVLI